MAFTDLQSLFTHNQFDLPYIETDDTRSFLHHSNVRMEKYLNELQQISQNSFGEYDKDEMISNVRHIGDRLSEVLRLYLDGFPAQAYDHFKCLVGFPKIASRLMHWRTITLPSFTTLYRTKKEHDVKKIAFLGSSNGFIKFIEPIDLFHVPFEKRKAIGTNRFSIPGFPCIYLSETLHTSWSEALENITEPFHAACFRNHRPLYIVDVVPIHTVKPATATFDFLGTLYNYDDARDAFIDYALIFPLITACHSKVSYTNAYPGEVKFKSEYIIPQLLLQWYRDNHVAVDGIRYLSCTANAKFPGAAFDKFNYVIPAINIKEEGYCDSLLHNFSATEVFSQLVDEGMPEIDMLDDITRKLDKAAYFSLK
jgi:hypothetical protein